MKQAEIGDIWWALIPIVNKDNNSVSVILEKRPCLIIDNGHGFILEENNDYLGLKITSKEKGVELNNWHELGLKRKSYVRIEIPIKIEKKQLLNKISKVNKYDMYLYLNELSKYINSNFINKFRNEEI